MKKNESIQQIMTKNIRTITLKTKLSETRSLFAELGVHHLPVTEGDTLIGLFSFSDFLRIDAGELYNQNDKQADVILDSLSSVKEVMTKNLITILTNTTIREANEKLAEGRFHSLPVVDNNQKLVGIVTTTDLLRYFQKNY